MIKKKLTEAGLVVSKNTGAYPKNGQILILAGGAGSGKGFVINNVLLFEGKYFNVDALKERYLNICKKYPESHLAQKASIDFQKRFGKTQQI